MLSYANTYERKYSVYRSRNNTSLVIKKDFNKSVECKVGLNPCY